MSQAAHDAKKPASAPTSTSHEPLDIPVDADLVVGQRDQARIGGRRLQVPEVVDIGDAFTGSHHLYPLTPKWIDPPPGMLGTGYLSAEGKLVQKADDEEAHANAQDAPFFTP